MDKQEYLNHISAKSKPVNENPSLLDRLMTPKNIKLIVIGLFIIIVLLIVGSIFGQDSNKTTDLTQQISLRLDNLTTTIDTYAGKIKSSELRAITTSLKATLSDTSRDLTTLLPNLGIDTKKIAESSVAVSETTHAEELSANLEYARLNGLLDRTFAMDMALQVSLLASLESELLTRTSNADLIELLTASSSDLNSLHTRIDDFANSN